MVRPESETMKKIITAVLIAGAVAITPSVTEAKNGNGQEQVDVCHDGDDGIELITVAEPAVDKLLARRDVLPGDSAGPNYAYGTHCSLVPVPLDYEIETWKRLAIVGLTVVATYVPFLIWDAEGLVSGVVTHHLTRAPRPDSASLAGLDILVPVGISIAVAVAIVIPIARRAWNSAQFLGVVASVMAVFTILSVRAFRNSWWLIIVIVSMSVGFMKTTDGSQRCSSDTNSEETLVPDA